MTFTPQLASRRHLFAIGAYATQLVLGVLHLTNVATPNSLIVATDYRVADAWSGALIVTSLVALSGMFGKVIDSLSREASGCLGLAVLNGLYVVVLYRYTHGNGVITTLVSLGMIALAALARSVQCGVERHLIIRAVREQVLQAELLITPHGRHVERRRQ